MKAGIRAVLTVFSLCCLLAFTLIVIWLQKVQAADDAYDWRLQFMSELALGTSGGWMLTAFLFLALSCLGFAFSLHGFSRACHRFLLVTFSVAAGSFLGAGLVSLRDHAMMHILFVLLAFSFLLAGMWGVFRVLSDLRLRLGTALAFAVIVIALLMVDGQLLAPGTGQRLVAAGCLGWMAYVLVVMNPPPVKVS
ncbi:MAG: hypothetical protein LBB76_04120 [Azoarcus sp.]|nr:hypothetical protein [Azoarcus sp.]